MSKKKSKSKASKKTSSQPDAEAAKVGRPKMPAGIAKWAEGLTERAKNDEIRGVVAIIVTANGEVQLSQQGVIFPNEIALPLLMLQNSTIEAQHKSQNAPAQAAE